MSEIRLIDANALKEDLRRYFTDGVLDGVSARLTFNQILHDIDNAPTVDFEKLGESLNCQIRATYGSCDDCLLSCPRNELIKLLGLARPQGEWVRKEDIIHYIATQYSEHNELVPIWLSIGDLKGGAE